MGLPEIHFTASGFFLKIFWLFVRFCLCFFLVLFFIFFFFFFFFFFFCNSTYYEKQEKKTLKITTIYACYEPVEQTDYCVEVFIDYHVKRALSLSVI